jgi:hypothetical protein
LGAAVAADAGFARTAAFFVFSFAIAALPLNLSKQNGITVTRL